ncbi:Poly(A) polymerase, partial [Nadsonia fulvescens var. elongata DSM 6958]
QIHGITPPISMIAPSAEDRSSTQQLMKELEIQGSFASVEDEKKRVEVLEIIQQLANDLVYNISVMKGLPKSIAKICKSKVYTFGSYKMGVYSPDSDIDTLIVLPKHVGRHDFFTHFETLLRERPELKEIFPIPEAYVPVMKIKFSGISLDIICSSISMASISQNLPLNDKALLKNLDDKNLRSLNGARVTDEIINLVPNKSAFKIALRAIKLWAQRKSIYGNIMGFPGGVAWAMMVARIAQLYPNASSSVLVEKFFTTFLNWNWPKPVLLKLIEDGPLNVRVWNPKSYGSDRAHLMPVITPAYPSMCSTHNITRSNQKIIMNEFLRASLLIKEVKATDDSKDWSPLFKKHDFFHRYEHYLMIIASTKEMANKEQHIKWSGFIESKIRLLVQKLELISNIDYAHPFNKPFNKRFHFADSYEMTKIIKGDIDYLFNNEYIIPENKLEKSGLAAIGSDILESTELLDQFKNARGENEWDLKDSCFDYLTTCTKWVDFNSTINDLSIKQIRNIELPDEMFDSDEKRPL